MQTQEEMHWHQRSRLDWLSSRDRNTSYFHCRASMRQKLNRIEGMTDDHGSWCTSTGEVHDIIIGYCTTLFFSSNPLVEDIQGVTNNVEPCVSHHMNFVLQRPFTEEEVRRAIFYLSPSKALSPDGFPAIFLSTFMGCGARESGEIDINDIE